MFLGRHTFGDEALYAQLHAAYFHQLAHKVVLGATVRHTTPSWQKHFHCRFEEFAHCLFGLYFLDNCTQVTLVLSAPEQTAAECVHSDVKWGPTN